MSPLLDDLRARGDALAQAVVAQMYENPFWDERFGARGRRFAEEDGRHHLRYLATALENDQPALFADYARWLQTVLTTRGMCTRHIVENFERLATAIAADDAIADPAPALRVLGEGVAALRYPAGATARELQDRAAALAEAAAGRIYVRHPDWAARAGEAGRRRCADDVGYHISYLADALALGQPRVFTGYVAFIGGFLERRRVPRGHLAETLVELRALLESPRVPAALRADATVVLDAAIAGAAP